MLGSFEGDDRGFSGSEGVKSSLLHEFTAAETWSVLSGLSSPKVAQVTLDGRDMTGGELALEVDGSVVEKIYDGERDNFVVHPSTSLNIISRRSQGVYRLDHISHISSQSFATGLDVLDIAFRTDGTELFVLDNANTQIEKHSLSTAWDPTTATQAQTLDVSAEDTDPEAIAVRPDGSRIFMTGASSAGSYRYDLSTAWDLSTATLGESAGAFNTGNPRGIAFFSQGAVLVILDDNGSKIKTNTTATYSLSGEGATFDVQQLERYGDLKSIRRAKNSERLYLGANFLSNGRLYEMKVPSSIGVVQSIYDLSRADIGSEVGTAVLGVDNRGGGDEIFALGASSDVHRYDLTSAFAGTGLASVSHN